MDGGIDKPQHYEACGKTQSRNLPRQARHDAHEAGDVEDGAYPCPPRAHGDGALQPDGAADKAEDHQGAMIRSQRSCR